MRSHLSGPKCKCVKPERRANYHSQLLTICRSIARSPQFPTPTIGFYICKAVKKSAVWKSLQCHPSSSNDVPSNASLSKFLSNVVFRLKGSKCAGKCCVVMGGDLSDRSD